MGMIENLLSMLESGQDSPLLRYSLGGQLLKNGDVREAIRHLESAVQQDPEYSAAWKLYGKALHESGELAAARDAYQQGIAVAEHRGDIQAAREMKVFLRRIEKAQSGS